VSPTFEITTRAAREYAKPPAAQRRQFQEARRALVAALRDGPSDLPPRLRVKRVQGHQGIWEMTWAAGGRATFEYGPEQLVGEAHVRWRRIGDHSIFAAP
jgi:hypothetical protein